MLHIKIMVYQDYKTAADSHLEVCFQLLHHIEENYQKKEPLATRQTKEKKVQLLADLYYLSGYIIECSYNCAIYKSLDWTNDVKDLRVTDTPYNVSTHPHTNSAFTIRRKGPGIKQHQLSGNMHFFPTIMHLTPSIPIPLISEPLHPTHPAFDLFENWNAEIRYLIDTSITLDYSNTFAFFYLANKVYEGLLSNSMI